VRIELPFQTVETVNESARDRQRSLELFSAGRETEWRNRLIWGDKKYVLASLLAEFAGEDETMFSRLLGRLRSAFVQAVPATYNPSLHYNCFVETVPSRDRQTVYQELRRMGLLEFSHVLPDGRLQLSVRNVSAALGAYNAVATDKIVAACLTKARLIELMVNDPDMEITALLKTSKPHVGHAEKARLAQIIIASESAFRRGVEYHEQKQYQRAIDCYDDATRIEPEDVRAWHNKIGALTQQGRHQAALEVADKILALHGNVGILWEAKGRTLVDMGRLPEAGECMSKACALNSNIAKRHALAVDREADKWLQALMGECRREGKNPETDIGFWWARFAAFANSGDPDKMFICLQMAATIGPEHSIVSSDSGMLLLPPGHPLLSKELLPDDATVERLRDFFQRMTTIAMRKKV
jgi:tetratricopeptide (TPR) repeat protein